MRVLSIDPGPDNSAWLVYDGVKPVEFGISGNAALKALIRHLDFDHAEFEQYEICVIEMIESMGMPVGKEVFQTCVWIGRFMEAFGPDNVKLVTRREVKLHLCGSMRAKDANVRQSLIDRFGGKKVAIGKKASPGPLFGISKDVWSALGIACTWWETRRKMPIDEALFDDAVLQ